MNSSGHYNRSFLLVFVVALALAVSAGAAEQRQGIPDGVLGGEPPVVKASFAADRVTWSPNVPFERGVLTVRGSAGIVAVLDFDYADTISFGLTDQNGELLADGNYTFELQLFGNAPGTAMLTTTDVDSPDPDLQLLASDRASGRFSIVAGRMVPPARPDRRALQRTSAAAPKVFDHTGDFSLSGKLLVGTDVSIAIEDIMIQCDDDDGTCPAGIVFQNADAGTTVTAEQWAIQVDRTAMGFKNGGTIDGDVVFRMETGAPADSLYVADNGSIGVGTAVPAERLHLASGHIRMEWSGYTTWQLNHWSNAFGFRNVTAGVNAFWVDNGAAHASLIVESDSDTRVGANLQVVGSAGIGTATPEKKLEVSGGDILLSNNRWFQARMNGGGIASMFWLDGSNDVNFSAPAGRNLTLRNGGSTKVIVAGNLGYVGMGTTSPAYPLHMGSGAHVTAGGVWTNASSRSYKENIADLPLDAALATVMGLKPVTFDYKNTDGEHHAGFIAEEVPDLVATADRTGLSSMDIVAVLTRVVQEQQKTIDALSARIEQLEQDR